MPTGCWREIEGDLAVYADTNLDELRDVRSVSGRVLIAMDDRLQEDLSFLECLESADSLELVRNASLRTTAGMTRLTSLETIRVVGSGAPLVLEGFDGLSELDVIDLDHHHTVERVELPTIERLRALWIGGCDWGTDAPPEPPGSLTSLGNFASLESLEGMSIFGQASLTELSVLDVLIANGAPPPEGVSLMGNVSLSSEEMLAKLEMLGVTNYKLCGNLGDELCTCPLD